MPVEKEYKYITTPELAKSYLEKNGDKYIKQEINQGYLFKDDNSCLRLRKTIQCGPDGLIPSYEMTYKRFVNNEVVEIENNVDKEDFHKLWGVCTSRISKTRYLNTHSDSDVKISIDLFHSLADLKKTYFALIEIENPTTESIKEEIEKYGNLKNIVTVFVSSEDQKLLTNTKLCCEQYAHAIYAKLIIKDI